MPLPAAAFGHCPLWLPAPGLLPTTPRLTFRGAVVCGEEGLCEIAMLGLRGFFGLSWSNKGSSYSFSALAALGRICFHSVYVKTSGTADWMRSHPKFSSPQLPILPPHSADGIFKAPNVCVLVQLLTSLSSRRQG